MKISKISSQTGVSINTIRYYISLGLLNPTRRNNQYVFSKADLDDILQIQRLKDMRFSLKEIEMVIRFGRTSNWIEPDILCKYSDMLREKKSELDREQEELQRSIDLVSSELQRISQRQEDSWESSGVPLRALPLLVCPKCGAKLHIEQAFFSPHGVMDGTLSCPCGYNAAIDCGIIKTGNLYTGAYDSPDLERNLYNVLCSNFLKIYQQSCSYLLKNLQEMDLRGKMVLEGCINGYFFLYNHFSDLPRDCLYVISDKYPEMLMMYKQLIDQLNLGLEVLYIADNDMELPLAHGCVDVCVDFINSNEWSLYHQRPYPQALAPFLAPDCQVVGLFSEIDAFSQTKRNYLKKYPEGSPDLYLFQHVSEAWKAQGFQVHWERCGMVKKTQNCFSFACHVDGEELRFYVYQARRRSKSGGLQGKEGGTAL